MIIDKQINLHTRYCFEPPLFIAKLNKKSGAVLELETLDLNDFLAPEGHETCMIKVNTADLVGDGIDSGDLIVVNFNRIPMNGNFVIVKSWGKLRLAKLISEKQKHYLFINSRRKRFNIKKTKGVVSHLIKNKD